MVKLIYLSILDHSNVLEIILAAIDAVKREIISFVAQTKKIEIVVKNHTVKAE
jgi:hypothetical protein